MYMSDVNENTHHASSDSYSFLIDIERSSIVENDAILVMLSSLDRDALNSTIAKLIQH